MNMLKMFYGKIPAVMMSFLLSTVMLNIVFPVLTSQAAGDTIYIRADGSIDPPSAPIQRVDDVYTLTSNINETIVIERDNIIVDGAGFILQGDGATGLSLSLRTNVTVRNFRIMGFLVGIKLEFSNNSMVSYNSIMNNGYYGIWLQYCSNNTLLGDTVTNAKYGFYIQNSSRNTLSNNIATNNVEYGIYLERSASNNISRSTAVSNGDGFLAYYSNNTVFMDNAATNNQRSGIKLHCSKGSTIIHNTARDNGEHGIYLSFSGNSTISGNIMSKNKYNFGVDGVDRSDFENNIEFLSNTANGRPIYYSKNMTNIVLDESTDPASIYIIDSTNVKIRNLNLTHNVHGIFLLNTNGTRIENVNASGNLYGIRLDTCSATQDQQYFPEEPNCSGIFTSIANSNFYGIYMNRCENYAVAGNKLQDNLFDGIRLYSSNNNLIVENMAENNTNGFVLSSSNYNWISSWFNTWSGFSVATNNTSCGIYLESSHNNYIWDNNLAANSLYGIHLVYSDDNDISHNTVMNNSEGICLRMSSDNTISDNNVISNTGQLGISITSPQGHGIYAGFCPNTAIYDNVVDNNTEGIHLFQSKDSVVSGNVMSGNKYNFGVSGSSWGYYVNVDLTNKVDGKPIYYLRNSSNIVIDSSIDAATVYVIDSSNVTIKGLNLTKNWCGITLLNTNNSKIENLVVTNNYMAGIWFESSYYVTVAGNEIMDNEIRAMYLGSNHNTFFHNNIAGRVQGAENLWDNGAEGNYWSHYRGNDTNLDGIGDIPYVINEYNHDHYPLIEPWNQNRLFNVTWEAKTYKVFTTSNSTIASLTFNQTSKQISFKTTGPDGTTGFCNVTIPKELLDALLDQWIITVNGKKVDCVVIENMTHTFIHFEFTHSTETISIEGTNPIDNTPPIANAGPDQTVNEDTIVTFDGSESTDNIAIVNYTWTFADKTPQTLKGVNPTYTFTNPGTYTITLNITDFRSNWNTDTITITVCDTTPPEANAGNNQTVYEGKSVSLDGSESTDNVEPTNYTWTFIDGSLKTFNEKNVAYPFQTPGNYTITLNVTDAAGNWATDIVTVTVLAVPIWSKSWFWPIIGLTAIASVSFPFGVKYYRNFKKQREILVEYESELETLPINHLDRARARFIKDLIRRNEKIDKFARIWGIKLRPGSTLEDVAKKLGIEIEQ